MRPPATDLAATFIADWKTVTATTPTKTVSKSAQRKLGARILLEAALETTSDGQTVLADLMMLDAGGQVVSTLVYTQDRKMLKALQGDLDKIVGSIKVAPRKAADAPPPPAPSAPPPAAAPAPAAPEPPATGARVLKHITVADLAGSWSTVDSETTGQADSSGGSPSVTATASAEWFEIKADGSYTRKYRGLANHHVVYETGKGQISMTPDAIVFTENGKEARRLRFLELRIDGDGTGHWHVLDASYEVNS